MCRQNNFDWSKVKLEDCKDHISSEPCPQCGSIFKEDPYGGFYLKCSNCGWEGW